MKDYLGNEIEIGDTVVFCAPHYRFLTKGIVIKETPQKIVIEYSNGWNYCKPSVTTYRIEPKHTVKVNV